MAIDTRDIWHPGELAVQSRAGVKDQMSEFGPRLIRDFMPEQHRDFFARLPMVILGSENNDGTLWATPLFGEPGFIRSPSSQRLAIFLTEPHPHPLFSHLQINSRVGLLGIELESRRRNRVNGVIVEKTGDQIVIAVQQSFGNCPKYIRRRQRLANPQYGSFISDYFTDWSSPLREFISNADTCFIASIYSDRHGKNNHDIDVSHRGGDPGFIRFDRQQRLIIPDYPGNYFFNTVGNLLMDSRAALLFLDFSGGHAISLAATAEVLWKDDDPALCGNYDRVIRLNLEAGFVIHNALPHLWRPIDNMP